MKLKLAVLAVDKWKESKQNISIIDALGISDQLKIFSNYVEQFILKGNKAKKPQSIMLEDEDKSECFIPNYDDIDTIDIKKGHDFYILLRRMKNNFKGIPQDLVLLCNTIVFEESDLQFIKDKLEIREIIPIQDKELICLINYQGLIHPIRYFKDPFEVCFASGGGFI